MITDRDFVGFEDEFQKIRESLINGQKKELDVVSLVGMPGNGKTTLAHKLYQDPSVRLHFDIRAWCTVSQLYQKRDLWLDLFCQLYPQSSETVDNDGMAEKIAQSLKRRRYFIVFDDVWDIHAWNDLRRYLPSDFNGSRILITTRLQDLAKQASSVPSNVHRLRLFNECESYDLLERKSGLKYYHSDDDLIQVAHQIAMSCQGLPLAIAVVAGHLATAEKNVKEWETFLTDLSSRVLNDIDRPYRVMLELSYNCLPNHLKPCFLYAGALGALEPVNVSHLKLIWIAEGLVCDNKSESINEKAEEYIMDLVNRSLVIPTRKRSIGGVKEFKMHDLLKDFCLKEPYFVRKIETATRSACCCTVKSLYLHNGTYGLALEMGSIFSRVLNFFGLFWLVDLIIFILSTKIISIYEAQLVENVQALRFKAEGFPFEPLHSVRFRHLKYLHYTDSSSYSIDFRTIVSMRSLQTLIMTVEPCSSDELSVPDCIWDLQNLRNVHVRSLKHVRFQVESNRLEKKSPFPENMETLSAPYFSSTSDAEILRLMPMLRKLRCYYGDCWEYRNSSYQFPNLDFLTQLVSLNIDFCHTVGPTPARYNFNFPSNLKKLSLNFFRISWDEISYLGRKLPNLEVLKIELSQRDGTWSVMAGDFPSLKYLKINWCPITEWLVAEESFPKLEWLHLEWLVNLEEIPISFEDAVSLRLIKVKYCSKSLGDSAMRIGNVQKEEMLNEEFVVVVTGCESDSDSISAASDDSLLIVDV